MRYTCGNDPFTASSDDFLHHQLYTTKGLDTWETFLKACRENNLKLSAKKCKSFIKNVEWCGRVIDVDGVRLDPSNPSGLQNVFLARTAAQFCEYLYWIWNGRNGYTYMININVSVLGLTDCIQTSKKYSIPNNTLPVPPIYIYIYTHIYDNSRIHDWLNMYEIQTKMTDWRPH